MTREEKQLLLVDLCGRLPYGVILNCCNLVGEKLYTIDSNGLVNNDYDLEEVKPYLFPMSSMTEEQREEYHHIVNYISPDDTENWAEGEFVYVNRIEQLLHFYHTNHLDYRGLIEKGLAIDCTNLNIY